MLRNCTHLRKALTRWTLPRHDPQAATSGILQNFSTQPVWTTSVRLSHSEKPKDYSLPNSSWSQEMMDQFNKLTEMSKDGKWQRLSSFRHSLLHAPESLVQKYKLERDRGTRLFLRNIDAEGMGFEYVMFLNISERKMTGIFQFGPYLEGPPGFVHGGAIATVLDTALGTVAMSVAFFVMTANLSINYKSPIPLGSVVLVESKMDSMEGRKLFASGEVRSVDRKILFADASEFGGYRMDSLVKSLASGTPIGEK